MKRIAIIFISLILSGCIFNNDEDKNDEDKYEIRGIISWTDTPTEENLIYKITLIGSDWEKEKLGIINNSINIKLSKYQFNDLLMIKFEVKMPVYITIKLYKNNKVYKKLIDNKKRPAGISLWIIPENDFYTQQWWVS